MSRVRTRKTPRRRQDAESIPHADAGDLDATVRRLARQARDLPQKNGAVVLDVCVDGYRCVLIPPDPVAAGVTAPEVTAPGVDVPSAIPGLTARELEIARLVAKGLPNKTIAAALEISAWTVATYLRRVFARLRVSSRAAMVSVLMQRGQLP